LSGKLETVGIMPSLNITLACDNDGIFYTAPTTTFVDDWNPEAGEQLAISNSVVAFTLDDVDEKTGIISLDNVVCEDIQIGELGIVLPVKQPMAVDPNTGHLFWLPVDDWEMAYIVEVDVKTGEVVHISMPFYDVVYGLVIPDKSAPAAKPDWAQPADSAIEVTISKTSANMFTHGTLKLNASAKPWTLPDQSVVWSSSNEEVATVSTKGVVTAHKPGFAVITAASKTTPDVTASCEISVKDIQVTLNGVLQDDEGEAQYFSWDMEHDLSWTSGAPLSLGSGITAVTTSGKYVYIGTEFDVQYQLDPVTGEVAAKGEGYGRIVADEAYSEVFSTADEPLVVSVVEGYVNYPCDPLALEGDYGHNWDFSYFLTYTDSSRFIAIASMGYAKYTTRDGDVLDTERFIAMTDNGALWSIYIPKDPETGSFSAPYFDYCMTDLPADFLSRNGDGIYCSMVLGEDGYLYFAAYNGHTSDLYRIEADSDDGVCEAIYMNNTGEDIWPAALISVSANEKVEADTISFGGYVRDEQGNALAGVTVQLYPSGQTVVTDENGKYEFTGVEFGEYTVVIRDKDGNVIADQQIVIDEGSEFSVNDGTVTAPKDAEVEFDMVINGKDISFTVKAYEPEPSKPTPTEPDVSVEPDPTKPDDNNTQKPDDNPPTGAFMIIYPAAVSTVAVLASKKRRK
ncbi:MAG: Ig-like domain-containing protein, partial [Ruminiclostridium sp.]|nr:Ig-like domain-containing protein [Ruminiclostridium sp.]